jgi:hypothetical protein
MNRQIIRGHRQLQRHIRGRQRIVDKAQKSALREVSKGVRKEIRIEAKKTVNITASRISRIIRNYVSFKPLRKRARTWIGNNEIPLSYFKYRVRRTKRRLPRRGPRTQGIVSSARKGMKKLYPHAYEVRYGSGAKRLFNRKSKTKSEHMEADGIGDQLSDYIYRNHKRWRTRLEKVFKNKLEFFKNRDRGG